MAEGKTRGTWGDLESRDCQELVFMAKLAEQAERYDEMKDFMKQVALKQNALNTEERNLMSVAYKNVVGARRASWRVLSSLKKLPAQESQLVGQCLETYIKEVEDQLSEICNDILTLLSESLISNKTIDHEQKVFYCKMKGDYHRYMAEYSTGEAQATIMGEAKHSYKQAMEHAQPLAPTNPIRLGLALNFSVFYYEILDDQQEACNLAKEAFDKAVGELEDLNEEEYKDATLIMQLLRDNLTLWQADDGHNDDMQTMEQDGTALEDCDF